MHIGGSTTSLLSILNLIDYNSFKVDLQLAHKEGELLSSIPQHVNVLDSVLPDKKKLRKMKLSNLKYLINVFKSKYYRNIMRKAPIANQIMNIDNASLSFENTNEYDIAIGFLELWSTYYVLEKVKAKMKVSWIHCDYVNAGFDYELDIDYYKKIDKIILVSKNCLDNFNVVFSELSYKTDFIENIVSKKVIESMSIIKSSEFMIDHKNLNVVTVSRIDFLSKGFDRSIKVLSNLKKNGYLNNFKWHVVGNGQDFKLLQQLIKKYDLSEKIILYGELINPFNILKECDVFYLGSYYEGKPMSVTESIILGVPVFVTNYSSANEQIIEGKHGWIVENNEDSIYNGFLYLIRNVDYVKEFRKNVPKSLSCQNEATSKILNLLKQ